MKTLVDLDRTVTDFYGNAVVQPDGSDMSIKDAMIQILSRMNQTGKDLFTMYELGQALVNANGSLDVEDHPFELLKQACENSQEFTILLKKPVMDVINAALKEAKDSKSQDKDGEV